MANEWNEYKAYIGQPTYAVSSGKDTSFLGRFTTDMIKDFKGFARIFTISDGRTFGPTRSSNIKC